MADNNKDGAKRNGLGELFVDFGQSGLGNLIKGLNSVSASFLLAKNLATQAIKPIADLSKKSGDTAISLKKINAVTGISEKTLYKLQKWAEINQIDFGGYISQLQTLQQALLGFRTGLDGAKAAKLSAMLGIDVRKLDYKNPIEALNTILHKVSTLDEATGAMALRLIGLDENLMYVTKNANKQLDKRLVLNDKELNNLVELKEAWNDLETTTGAALDKIGTKTKWVINLVNGLKSAVQYTAAFATGDVDKQFEFFEKGEKIIGGIIKHPRTAAKKVLYNVMVEWSPYVVMADYLQYKVSGVSRRDEMRAGIRRAWGIDDTPNKKTSNMPAPPPPISLKELPYTPEQAGAAPIPNVLPQNDEAVQQLLNNSNTTVNVNVTQNIQGTDAREIGNNSADAISDTLYSATGRQYNAGL